MVRAVIGEWGENVGAFMFGNEPGNQVWKSFYGGDYSGGPWVAKYARFVEEGAAQIKADHPNVPLVNAVQVEQVAITQLKQSAPRIDALCMHHYTFPSRSDLPFEPDTLEPMSPTQQAKQVARMLVLGFLTATKTFLYALADQRWTTRPGGNDFGVVSDDLTTPKPGYFVLGGISALTGGAATAPTLPLTRPAYRGLAGGCCQPSSVTLNGRV